MFNKRVLFVLALSLAACGGGGSSSSTPSAPVVTPTLAPSVSGDMIALSPNRGWNYQTTFGGNSLTVSTYSDPNPISGISALVGGAVTGLVPTVLTSPSNMASNEIGALGFTSNASGYNVVSEVSLGSAAAVPGSPLFVQSTLTKGATWQPYAGATATVLNVGTVPNSAACTTPGTGAQVRYQYASNDWTISYVPGCGITDALNNANGAQLKLISMGSYPAIGQLAIARRAESATMWNTARSLLGLERSEMPAAALLGKFGL